MNNNFIGIIPSTTKTFEVFGDFNSTDLVEGGLYYDPKDERVYMYSKIETRPSPKSGFFPIWNGKSKYSSSFANEKYFSKDVIKLDMTSICNHVTKELADEILYKQRRSTNSEILNPIISDGDNMFTQCIKGSINTLKISMIDLIDMTQPRLDDKMIENYYNALNKITFMRLDKWYIWVDTILHLKYTLNIYNGDKTVITYKYPERSFEINGVDCKEILDSPDDDFKKLVKICMKTENITKAKLADSDVDDYTINNMMTTITGTKALSAQLFSRFIRMADLSYDITIYDKDNKQLFEYKE